MEEKEATVSKCGNRCDLCPANYKNINKFDRQKISDGWFKYHGFRKPADEIGCVGCLNKGKHDREDCPIKECAEKRGLENCGYCDDLFCDFLESDMGVVEGALKEHSNISQEDYDMFFKPYLIRSVLMEIHKNFNKK